MQIFRGRPLALAICISVLVSVLAVKWSAAVKLILLSVFFILLLVLMIRAFCKGKCGRVASVLMLSLILSNAVLIGSWSFFNCSVDRFENRAADGCTVEGYVCERLGGSSFESQFEVMLDEIDGERESTKVWLRLAYPSSLQIGERFRLYGKLIAAEDLPSYPEEKLMLADGCVGILYCESAADCTVLSERQDGLLLRIKRWNFSLSERLRHAIGGEAGDLGAAFLLGDRSGLSGDTMLSFRRSGISHLLALSGMHVSALILILEWLLQRFRIPKRVRAWIIPLVALFYLILTGCSLSTVRAVLMIFAVYLAFLLEEESDPFTSLCVALAVSIISAPYAILEVSLWLSFSAAAGIVVFSPAIRSFFQESAWIKRLPRWGARLLKGFAMALAVGLFANAAALGFLAYFFGSASLFSVPITMLLSPLLLPMLLLSALALFLPKCMPITVVANFCLRGMLWLADTVSDIPYGTVHLDGSVTVLLLIALILSLILLAVLRIERMRWLLLPILLSSVVMLVGYLDVLPSRSGTAVSYISLEEGDALVITEGRRTVAVDLSNGSYEVREGILAVGETDRFTELQELVFTHYYAKMPQVLSSLAERIKLRAIRLPTPITEDESAIMERVAQEAELHGICVLREEAKSSISSAELVTLLRADPDVAESKVLCAWRICDQTVTYLDVSLLHEPTSGALQAYFSADTVILSAKIGTDVSAIELPSRNALAGAWIFSTDVLMESACERFPQIVGEKHVGNVRFFLK